jgi:hypothetical protein
MDQSIALSSALQRRRLLATDAALLSGLAAWTAIRWSAGLVPGAGLPLLALLIWFGVLRPAFMHIDAGNASSDPRPRIRAQVCALAGVSFVTAGQFLYAMLRLELQVSGNGSIFEEFLWTAALLSWVALAGARRAMGPQTPRTLIIPLFGLYLSVAVVAGAGVILAVPDNRALARRDLSTAGAEVRAIGARWFGVSADAPEGLRGSTD